ncbi:MAG: YidC/Oxa1 family membrane protein insertase [bacterium]|nr:YidC/Oxa1 family membrane protein insertase [bacterium]
MHNIFTTIFYQPIFNLLIWLYNVIPGNDIGVAIVALTVIIKVLLYPLSWKSIQSQRALTQLQPKIEALKKEVGSDKERLTKEMMELYKREKVNPFSSCLPLLLQLPFLFAVYQVFQRGLKSESLDLLYGFVQNPGTINPISFGLVDLAKPVIVFAILAGAAQYFQAKQLMHKKPPKEVADKPAAKDEGMAAMMNKQMLYFMPIFTVIIGLKLPGGLSLYWFVMTLLSLLQQVIVLRKKKETAVEVV